ncbi:hypothetical protein [Lentilactobacillus senioris]
MFINSDHYNEQKLEKHLAKQDLDGHEEERTVDHDEHEWEERNER